MAPSDAGTDITDSISVAETAEEFTAAEAGDRRRAEIPRAETRREAGGGPFTVYLVTLRGGGRESILDLPKVCFRRTQTLPQLGRQDLACEQQFTRELSRELCTYACSCALSASRTSWS